MAPPLEEPSVQRALAFAQVVRHLEGLRTRFGLPAAAVALIEADREALGLGRHEYLLHLLFQRTLALREQPGGFRRA